MLPVSYTHLEAGISYDEELVVYGDYTMNSGYMLFPYIMGKKVTAIFSMNDEMAFGIYRAARMYGVGIPEEDVYKRQLFYRSL